MNTKKNLIIYEQDFTFLEDIKRRFMLEPNYQIVSTVQDENSLLQTITQNSPDYILISLPINNLPQLVNQIKMYYPKVHIIIAINSIEQLQEFSQLPVTLLNKPYTVDSLIDKLKKLDTRQDNQFNNIPKSPSNLNNTSTSLNSLRNAMSSLEQNNYTSQNAPLREETNMSSSLNGNFGGNNQYSQNNNFGNSDNGFNFNIPQNNNFGNSNGGFNIPQNNNLGNSNNGFNIPQSNNLENSNNGFNIPQNNNLGNSNNGFNVVNNSFGGNFNQSRPNVGGGSTYRTIKQTIIAVNCPKGGVGKTTLSKELATAFASVRINGQPLNVLLVDCDLDFGDVASMLKLNSYPNIVNWLEDIRSKLKANPDTQVNYTQEQIEQYLIQHPTGLKVLAAPSSHSDALDITDREFEIVLNNLKENCNFDIIILDTGNNTKDYTLLSLDRANTILMVTTMDVTTIYDTNMLLNTLRTIQFPVNKIKLVVNKIPHGNDRDIDTQEISQVLRTDIIAKIPEEPRIRQLNNVGTPAVLGKETEYTAAIRNLGQQLVPVFNRQINPSNNKKKQKNSLFSKLFGRK